MDVAGGHDHVEERGPAHRIGRPQAVSLIDTVLDPRKPRLCQGLDNYDPLIFIEYRNVRKPEFLFGDHFDGVNKRPARVRDKVGRYRRCPFPEPARLLDRVHQHVRVRGADPVGPVQPQEPRYRPLHAVGRVRPDIPHEVVGDLFREAAAFVDNRPVKAELGFHAFPPAQYQKPARPVSPPSSPPKNRRV